MAVVSGKALWACVNHLNTTYDPASWSIDLEVDEGTAATLEAQGLNRKKTDDDTIIFKFKRNEYQADKVTRNVQPKCVDRDNMPFDENIGNSSKVRVQYRTYDWVFGKKSGVGADLQAIQVIDLVEYGAKDGDEFDVEPDGVSF